MNNYKITILVDDSDSWIMLYAERFTEILVHEGHSAVLVNNANQIKSGDMAFFLGCKSLVSAEILKLNKNNLVVHESALPSGKGWSPLTWQILEGKNEIPICLFEATEKVDSGCIYFQDILKFEGHELLDELHDQQGSKTISMCHKFVYEYPDIVGEELVGEETFYPRRTPDDSKMDIQKPIVQLFNNFRVADNKKYPVFFEYENHKYVLTIKKSDECDVQ